MSEDSSVAPFFTFLAVLLYFFLTSRAKKRKPEPRRVVSVKPISPKQVSPKPASVNQVLEKTPLKRNNIFVEIERGSYRTAKKRANSFLQKDWQDRDSLKKAFILSEILKKVDERDPF